MKFLLVGHGGCYNRGCEAILRTTISLLNNEFSYPKIIVSTFDYENDKNIDFGPNVSTIPAWSSALWKRFTRDWFVRQFLRFFNKDRIWELEYSPIVRCLHNVNAVISIGGDNYTSDYNSLPYFLKLNRLVKKYRKKIIIWGASIGPFSSYKLESIVNNLKEVDLITVREKKTLDYLNRLNINKNTKLVADSAFLLAPDADSIEEAVCDINDSILGFNISPILEKYSGGLNSAYIIKESTLFLQKVITEMKYHVFLIPHVTKNTGFNNDHKFMDDIYMALRNTNMIMQIPSSYNAMQMKSIISKCRFFIGARTHSTIAAFSSMVPTISIAYSIKAMGINEDIFESTEHVIKIKDFSSDVLFSKLQNLLLNENNIKKVLENRMLEIKRMSHKNIEYFQELIKK